jgi:hypothetical protein
VMSDFKVELVEDCISEMHVEFHGPADSAPAPPPARPPAAALLFIIPRCVCSPRHRASASRAPRLETH